MNIFHSRYPTLALWICATVWAVVHLNFRAGLTFPVPVCTVPSGQTLCFISWIYFYQRSRFAWRWPFSDTISEGSIKNTLNDDPWDKIPMAIAGRRCVRVVLIFFAGGGLPWTDLTTRYSLIYRYILFSITNFCKCFLRG